MGFINEVFYIIFMINCNTFCIFYDNNNHFSNIIILENLVAALYRTPHILVYDKSVFISHLSFSEMKHNDVTKYT